MRFIYKVCNSIYNPSFYLAEKTKPSGSAFGYYVKLTLLVVLIELVVFGIIIFPKLYKFISIDSNQIASYFPTDLQLTLKNGHVSTNVEEPYVITLPLSELHSLGVTSSSAINFVVIDTKNITPLESFNSYATSMLITKDYVITKKENSSALSVQPLSNLPDMVINRASITQFIMKIKPMMYLFVPLFALGFLFGMWVITLLTGLFINLIFSLVIWFVERLKKTDFTYKQIFRLGLYGLTAQIIIGLVLSLFAVHIYWYINGLIFLLVMFVNLRTEVISTSKEI